MSKRIRLDQLLVNRGMAESSERAAAMIMAGEVLVDGQRIDKAGSEVLADADIRLKETRREVGRGALKIRPAFEHFSISAEGKVCADVGASTGGFTEILLSQGAAKVYAIDVGYGELNWKLRSDQRVVPLERTNVRYLEFLPELVSLVTIDLSFISLRLVLPIIVNWLDSQADILALIKPQFEARKEEVGEGGIIVDRRIHKRVVSEILECAEELGFRPQGVIPSPITGRKGNQEYLAWISWGKGEACRNLAETI